MLILSQLRNPWRTPRCECVEIVDASSGRVTRDSENAGSRTTFVRNADLHVSHLSREKTILLTRAYEERAKLIPAELSARNVCLSAVVPALCRTGHPLAVSGPKAITED